MKTAKPSTHSQLTILRSIRKDMPLPSRALPDRKRRAVRARVKHLPIHRLSLD